jgi:hypothetical protein
MQYACINFLGFFFGGFAVPELPPIYMMMAYAARISSVWLRRGDAALTLPK